MFWKENVGVLVYGGFEFIDEINLDVFLYVRVVDFGEKWVVVFNFIGYLVIWESFKWGF